jgi:tetratricopeptide (TPR) repeat protein
LTPDEQTALDSAELLKAEGNALYAKQDRASALEKYLEAAAVAPAHRPAHTGPARAVYFANAAACACAQSDWTRACEFATRALELRPDYLKALMRRSAAREALDDPEGALADARRVGELAAAGLGAGAATATTTTTTPTPVPDRAALQWARSAVARLEPLAIEKQEKMKAEVLGKLKDLGNSILGRFGMSLDDFSAEKDPATGSYSIKFGRGGGGGEEEEGQA